MDKRESKYFFTGSLMNDALLLLLEKKDFEFITVKELCQKAGVNRSTFYLHYENMNDLLEETISSLNKKFSASFEGVADSDETLTKVLTSTKYLVPYLNFIKENRRAYRVIHQNPDLFGARNVNKSMYEQVFSPALNNFGVKAKEKPYVLAFYTYGSLAIITEWLKNDCVDDIDFIADLISRNTRANELN